jgi:hypothetical protein
MGKLAVAAKGSFDRAIQDTSRVGPLRKSSSSPPGDPNASKPTTGSAFALEIADLAWISVQRQDRVTH